MKAAVAKWVYGNRKVLMLKLAVGGALAYAHYFPETKASLWVNLLWLALF